VLRPDVILFDLNMPGMDGRKALREIKSDELAERIETMALPALGGTGKRASPEPNFFIYTESIRKITDVALPGIIWEIRVRVRTELNRHTSR